MSEPVKKPECRAESYKPGEKPVIISLVEKKISESQKEPAIEIYRAHREAYQVLGLENKYKNSRRNPACAYNWRMYDETAARQKVIPYMVDDIEMGIFYDSPPDYYAY